MIAAEGDGRALKDFACCPACMPVGLENGLLNDVEAGGNIFPFPTSVNGDRAAGKGEAKPNPSEEVREAEGNWRAEGGCWVIGLDMMTGVEWQE